MPIALAFQLGLLHIHSPYKKSKKRPIVIGHSGTRKQIPLLLEAKNQDRVWRAIEEEFAYLSNFGINPIILKPQKIIVTSVKIYQRSFNTELRLKYGTILF